MEATPVLANTPSLGIYIGLPVIVIGLVGGAVACAWGWRQVRQPHWTSEAAFLAFWGGAATFAFTLIIGAVTMWPFKWDYHSYTAVNGKVERISSRLVGDGDKGTKQRFVVVINGQPYGVDDTRASLVKPGMSIRLKCKREYEFGSGDNGWGCKWNGGEI